MTPDAYQALVIELNAHAHRYYALDAPSITDRDYDKKYQQLKAFESEFPLLVDPNSPTQRVGDKLSEKFEPFIHSRPMGSLGNVFNQEELAAFCERLEKEFGSIPPMTVEPKIDGCAVAIHYKNGQFEVGATRGDGKQGETVSHTAKTIRSLPLSLKSPVDLEARGEVFIRKSSFRSLDGDFSNARNTAAGALRQLDPQIASERKLDVFIYQGFYEGQPETHFDTIQALSEFGLPVIPSLKLCRSVEDVYQAVQTIFDAKVGDDFESDGAVIKVNEFALQEQMGSTTKAPRWAVAFKGASEQAVTKLNAITVQVGRTGVLTPVGELEPVFVGGAQISRVTLHNIEDMQRKDVYVGDEVVIHRAGDVIPEVLGVHKPGPRKEAFSMPTSCPECGDDVHQEPGDVATRCYNLQCPAQIKGRLEHFVSRKALDIDGLGSQLIEQLVESKGVKTPADLYSLSYETLMSCERMGSKSANNVLKALESSKKTTFSAFIYGLGIPFVGQFGAELITEHFTTVDSLLSATVEELEALHGLGQKTAESVVKTLHDQGLATLIHDLVEKGFEFETIKKADPTQSPYAGKSFLFTGTLTALRREDAKQKVKQLGAKNLSSVSKSLDYLVIGESAGSKLKKAQALIDSGANLKILTEQQFLDLF